MTRSHAVADVGNSRLKWGLIRPSEPMRTGVLELDPTTWDAKLPRVALHAVPWTIAGSNPPMRAAFAAWLRAAGAAVREIVDRDEIGVPLRVRHPETVGLDRLLNARAALLRSRPFRATAIVAAGTAVTVDLLGEDGVFLGGTIAPGLRILAQSLHEHTACLPFVYPIEETVNYPGRETVEAIAAGVRAAFVGGVRYVLDRYDFERLFLTGGDAEILLAELADHDPIHEPHLTLLGLAGVAEQFSSKGTIDKSSPDG